MAHIEFLDETMRDGQQSLWGMRMQAGMALPVAPLIDRSGYRVVDLAGSSLFEVMIRTCREDPWEGLDLLVAAMPRTLDQLARIKGIGPSKLESYGDDILAVLASARDD